MKVLIRLDIIKELNNGIYSLDCFFCFLGILFKYIVLGIGKIIS